MQNTESSLTTNYYLSDNIFFLIEHGYIIVWNYESHEQYKIKDEYFKELLHISQHNQYSNHEIFTELFEANLITTNSNEAAPWGWDQLSKIFHIGTSNVFTQSDNDSADKNFADSYLKECMSLKSTDYTPFTEISGELVNLPTPNLSILNNTSYYDALIHRKTSRKFNSKAVSLDTLSTILFTSFGLIHGEWDELSQHKFETTGIRKAAPSAGGLHSEEIYLAVFRVDGITPGIYHYRPQDHKLALISKGDFENEIIDINYKQDYSYGLGFGIYITSVFSKIWWKYKHSRAYRAALLDIGHLSQVFLTTATASGLQTWLTGAFVDKRATELLHIKNNSERVMLFVGAGYGTNQAIPDCIIEHLNQ